MHDWNIIIMLKAFSKSYFKQFLVLVSLIMINPFVLAANADINYNFDDQSFGILSGGNYWTILPHGGVDDSPAARLEYSTSGTSGKALILNVEALQSNEFWIEFDVKMEGSVSGGCKFIKLFGSNSTDSQNNMTVGVDYYGNIQREVAYYGDTVCTARWNGVTRGPCESPTYAYSSDIIDMRGGNWGHYKVWVKRASPGQIDGEVKVWWNEALRAHITDMDSNPYDNSTPYFERIELGGYNNSNFNGSTWYLWIDNLSISTTYINPDAFDIADLNADGTVNIQDVTLCVNIILGNTNGNGDANRDGVTDVQDVMYIANEILGRIGD